MTIASVHFLESCDPPHSLGDDSCNHHFSKKRASTGDFSPGWLLYTNDTVETFDEVDGKLVQAFAYVADNKLKAGGYDYYSKGYYLATLESNKEASLKVCVARVSGHLLPCHSSPHPTPAIIPLIPTLLDPLSLALLHPIYLSPPGYSTQCYLPPFNLNTLPHPAPHCIVTDGR